MESLNFRRSQAGTTQYGNAGSQPFPQRRRIVSEPADAFLLVSSSDFFDNGSNIDNLRTGGVGGCGTIEVTRSSNQHNFLQLSNETATALDQQTSFLASTNESQFAADFLNESFEGDASGGVNVLATSPPPPPVASTIEYSSLQLTTGGTVSLTVSSGDNGGGGGLVSGGESLIKGQRSNGGNVCTDCDRLFSRPERLRQHVLFKHAGAGSLTGATTSENLQDCSRCGKGFSSKLQLTRHLKIHQHPSLDKADNGLPFECGEKTTAPEVVVGGGNGGRSYSSYTSFMKHRKSHDGDGPSPPPAGSASGGSSAGSTPSKRPHKEQGEKRFQCTQCNKRFPTSKDLKRHDVVHTGNREFQCSFCSHRFGRKDHRMRHEKKTHAAELLQQQQKAAAAQAAGTTTAAASSGSPNKSPPTLNATTAVAGTNSGGGQLQRGASATSDSLINPIVSAVHMVKRQRLRHVSSPSTFRHDVTGSGSSPPRALFQNMLVSSPPPAVKEEFKSEEESNYESVMLAASEEEAAAISVGMVDDASEEDYFVKDSSDMEQQQPQKGDRGDGQQQQIKEEFIQLPPPLTPLNTISQSVPCSSSSGDTGGVMFMQDVSMGGLVRIVSSPEEAAAAESRQQEQQSVTNGELESLLSEIIADSPMVGVEDEEEAAIRRECEQLSASVPSCAFQSMAAAAAGSSPPSLFRSSPSGSSPDNVAASAPSGGDPSPPQRDSAVFFDNQMMSGNGGGGSGMPPYSSSYTIVSAAAAGAAAAAAAAAAVTAVQAGGSCSVPSSSSFKSPAAMATQQQQSKQGAGASPMMSDLFTRTKNPVLPSIYIDNSLIVPEPTKTKYSHSTHSLIFGDSDYMELDSFLRNSSSTNSSPGDTKEITESIFNM